MGLSKESVLFSKSSLSTSYARTSRKVTMRQPEGSIPNPD
jgi:hypothetical protein